MRETIEFRIHEEEAREFLEPDLGKLLSPLPPLLRQVLLPRTDPRVEFILELDREFRRRGSSFFTYWHFHRHYTPRELERAELLLFGMGPAFEPTGSMCGTEYDEAAACPRCGSGAPQLNDLHLDVRRIPRNKDMATTIVGEAILSSRLVEALEAEGITGAQYRPVRHKTGKLAPEWRQLVITSAPVDIIPPTLVGGGPSNLDEEGRYRCPRGDLIGLNRLSELWVARAGHDGSDWVQTRQFIGARRGELRPWPEQLISPRLYRLLKKLDIKRFAIEVAHWG
jgi:hypothetical protein